jgi:alpha-D-ribose 1-methylphosphonate 5-phosphate C-P lyase
MNARSEFDAGVARGNGKHEGYNFAYLDERTKRMIRRALLKAVAIPGYQVPFGSREMPLPYGWGTGGIQVTASIIGSDDTLKVIDQGADDTVNAVNIRRHTHPDPPPHSRNAARGRPDHRLSGAHPRAAREA